MEGSVTDERGLGDNGGPPLDEPTKFTKRKWALTLLERPKKPVGAVAMAFKLYMEMDAQGCGAVIPDADFVVSCGVSDRSIRTFKKWLLDTGFVEIKVKGTRGRQTEFIARIPGEDIQATVAALNEQIAATNSGNNEEDRQPLPEVPTELPVMAAADPITPEEFAGDLADSRAGTLARSYNNIYNNNNTLASSESVVGTALAGLNGAQHLMVEQLATWINPITPDRITASRSLTTQISIFGAPIVKQAFGELQAQIDSGDLINRPIPVFNRICQRIQSKGGKGAPASGKGQSFAEWSLERAKGVRKP
jgi:hypothetical protein